MHNFPPFTEETGNSVSFHDLTNITCRLTQGTIPGPILFSVFLNSTVFSTLESCLSVYRGTTSANFLQSNRTKTEILIFGPEHLNQQITSSLLLTATNKSVANYLVVTLDSHLSLEKHVCLYQVRNIYRIRHM